MHRQNLPGVHIIVEYLFIVEGSDSDDGKEVKGLESKHYASISRRVFLSDDIAMKYNALSM